VFLFSLLAQREVLFTTSYVDSRSSTLVCFFFLILVKKLENTVPFELNFPVFAQTHHIGPSSPKLVRLKCGRVPFPLSVFHDGRLTFSVLLLRVCLSLDTTFCHHSKETYMLSPRFLPEIGTFYLSAFVYIDSFTPLFRTIPIAPPFPSPQPLFSEIAKSGR